MNACLPIFSSRDMTLDIYNSWIGEWAGTGPPARLAAEKTH